jgi:hypothetical protein
MRRGGKSANIRLVRLGTAVALPGCEPHGAANHEGKNMTKKLSIAIAAGLLLSGPAFADDQDQTRTQTQDATHDRVQDPAKDQTKDPVRLQDGTAAGLGAQVRVMARDQVKGEGAMGVGEQVSTLAREQARDRVRAALADQAGPPADAAAVPGMGTGEGAGDRAADRHQAMTRKSEAERAALRHTERTAAREQKGEASATRRGPGAGAGGHGGMTGSGPGAGDCTQAAETTRAGGMRGPGPGGMH